MMAVVLHEEAAARLLDATAAPQAEEVVADPLLADPLLADDTPARAVQEGRDTAPSAGPEADPQRGVQFKL